MKVSVNNGQVNAWTNVLNPFIKEWGNQYCDVGDGGGDGGGGGSGSVSWMIIPSPVKISWVISKTLVKLMVVVVVAAWLF